MPTDNLDLWNKVCTTDPDNVKEVSYGKRRFTAVDAYSQIRAATEQWGPYGSWGLRKLEWGMIRGAEGTVLEITLDAEFFYPDEDVISTFAIGNDAPFSVGQDTRKKLFTDTLTKALSYLGFNSDVFLGKYDDQKYVAELKREKVRGGKKAKPEGASPRGAPAPSGKADPPPAAVTGAYDKPLGFGKYSVYTWRELVEGGSEKSISIDKTNAKKWCEAPAEVGGGRYSWLDFVVKKHAGGDSGITDAQATYAAKCKAIIDRRADEAA